jgi:hypothetical protein
MYRRVSIAHTTTAPPPAIAIQMEIANAVLSLRNIRKVARGVSAVERRTGIRVEDRPPLIGESQQRHQDDEHAVGRTISTL